MNEVNAAVVACENRDIKNLSAIVPKTVDPNIMIFSWEKNGMLIKQGNLLEIAAYSGAYKCVQYLVENKAEIDKTPLYMACISGYSPIVEYLLQNGANPNVKDTHGWTPLHRAVLWEHTQIISLLLKAGVDPNVTDEDGFTPMHVAAKWDRFDAAKLLIENGGNVNAQTLRFEPSFVCRTPLELAYLNNRTKVARVLRKAGAEALTDFIKKLSPEEKKDFNAFGLFMK